MQRFLLAVMLGALVAGAWFVWNMLRGALVRRRMERACDDFKSHRAAYEQQFFAMAAASGKPRGLRWKECRFHEADSVLARDRATGQLITLVGVTIAFEAVEGGGMEEVEAVGNLRFATAVFTWSGNLWSTQGRAVFNLEPREVLERYADGLGPVSAGSV